MAGGMEDNLEIKAVDRDGVRVFELWGNHTVYNARVLKTNVEKALKEGMSRIVVDLKNCAYVDSAGLGTFVSCRFHVTKSGGSLVICNASKSLLRVLKLSKVDKVLPVFDSLDDAMKAQQVCIPLHSPSLRGNTAQ